MVRDPWISIEQGSSTRHRLRHICRGRLCNYYNVEYVSAPVEAVVRGQRNNVDLDTIHFVHTRFVVHRRNGREVRSMVTCTTELGKWVAS
jgi:hypothetical protein